MCKNNLSPGLLENISAHELKFELMNAIITFPPVVKHDFQKFDNNVISITITMHVFKYTYSYMYCRTKSSSIQYVQIIPCIILCKDYLSSTNQLGVWFWFVDDYLCFGKIIGWMFGNGIIRRNHISCQYIIYKAIYTIAKITKVTLPVSIDDMHLILLSVIVVRFKRLMCRYGHTYKFN